MSSLRSRIGSRIGSALRIGESDKGRPPSPGGSSITGGSSIKTSGSKKRKLAIFGKRAVQKSMESVRSEESVAVFQPTAAQGATVISAHEPEPVTPLVQTTPASLAVGDVSAFEIIPSMHGPQPGQGENDGAPKSMERSERSEESIAVVHRAASQAAIVMEVHESEPAKDVTPLVHIIPPSPAVGKADSKAVFDAVGRAPVNLQPVPVQLEGHHGDALRRMDQGDHHDTDSLDQSAILNSLDSIVYAGGARRLSLDTSPPITAEGEVSGSQIEAPKSPVGDYRTVGLLVCLVALVGWSIFCVFLGSYFGGFAPATAGDGDTLVLDLPSPNCPLPSPTTPLCTSVPPVQTISRWIF